MYFKFIVSLYIEHYFLSIKEHVDIIARLEKLTPYLGLGDSCLGSKQQLSKEVYLVVETLKCFHF